MPRTEDPLPRETAGPVHEFEWPVTQRWPIEVLRDPPVRSFESVFEGRRSVRAMTVAPLDEIIGALMFATKPRFSKMSDPLGRTRRPSLSAGALHPLSILLTPGGSDSRLLRVNSDNATIEELPIALADIDCWLRRCAELLPLAKGSSIALVADCTRTAAAYSHYESLVWRDAGALLQTLALVCEAYGLAFCPLGLLGREIVDGFHAGSRLIAAGAAMIGKPLLT